MKQASRYRAKSLDHKILVTMVYIYLCKVKGGIPLTDYIPKNDVHLAIASLDFSLAFFGDMKQNHWIVKYGSMTYIYYEVKGRVTLIS